MNTPKKNKQSAHATQTENPTPPEQTESPQPSASPQVEEELVTLEFLKNGYFHGEYHDAGQTVQVTISEAENLFATTLGLYKRVS